MMQALHGGYHRELETPSKFIVMRFLLARGKPGVKETTQPEMLLHELISEAPFGFIYQPIGIKDVLWFLSLALRFFPF